MLKEWLGSTSLDRFRRTVLHRRAIAVPGGAQIVPILLSWSTLDHVLPPDVELELYVQGSRATALPPRQAADVRTLLRANVAVYVRHVEQHDPRLRRVVDGFDADLGPATLDISVLPDDAFGRGWRFSDEDTFVAQALGQTDFYFRANTLVEDEPFREEMAAQATNESSTLLVARLGPGDFLYLPARWWHVAVCRETSLALHVAVRPRPISTTVELPADEKPDEKLSTGDLAVVSELPSAIAPR